MKQNDFAARLTQVMSDKGVSQTRLQEMIREKTGKTLQRQTISLYMNGQSKPDTERLTMLCDALDVSADWLLGRPHAVRTPDPQIRDICFYTGLSEKAVMHLPKLSIFGGLVYDLDDDYEENENADGILDTLSRFLEKDDGIEFLNALYLVGNAVRRGKEDLEEYRDSNPEYLEEAADRIDYQLFKLSKSAQKLAESLYQSDRVAKELRDESM